MTTPDAPLDPTPVETGGFAGGDWIPPDPTTPVEGEAPDGGLLAGLVGDGKAVTHAKAVEWLQEVTGGLDAAVGGADGMVKADLRMNDREASWIAAGIVEYSKRTQLVALAVEPPPTWKAGAGLILYGWRVRGEHFANLELDAAMADAASGAGNIQPVHAFEHDGDVAS